MSLAKKFEFCTKYARATRYTLSLDSTGKYICTASSLEGAYDLPATYSLEFVQAAIDCGNWIVTKVIEEVAVEREMVFPFTAKHWEDASRYPDRFHVVSKSVSNGMVDVIWYSNKDTYDKTDYAFWTVEDAKRLVKDGLWLVKHVGEKIEEKPAQYSVKIDNDGFVKGFGLQQETGNFVFNGALSGVNGFYVEGMENTSATAPQPPESTTISTLKVDIQCDTTEAVANAKALAGAIEEINVAMESYIALVKEMKNV